MDRRTGIAKYLDWPTFFLYLILALIGWVNIHSAAYDPENPSMISFSEEYGKQFIWILTGLLLGAMILLIEGDFFRKYGGVIYGTSILLLVMVFPFGTEVNNAKSWIQFGGFAIQPAEFAKPALGLGLASYLSGLGPRDRGWFKTIFLPLVLIAIPIGLIMLQPDTGTALTFLAFFIVLYREGWSGNILAGGFIIAFLTILTLLSREMNITIPFTEWSIKGTYILMASTVLIGILVNMLVQRFTRQRNRGRTALFTLMVVIGASAYIYGVDHSFEEVLEVHQKERIKILLGQMEDPKGAGYNVEQAKTAIGSGGLWGKGYMEGPLTKYKYVPMQSTDFIFCTIGEEWGFIGTSIVVFLFTAFLLRLIVVAERQRSPFSRIFGYSVVSIIFMHVGINVGMAIGLAPVIGIPLPFFSYGGSSFWAFTVLIFILLRMDGERLMVLR